MQAAALPQSRLDPRGNDVRFHSHRLLTRLAGVHAGTCKLLRMYRARVLCHRVSLAARVLLALGEAWPRALRRATVRRVCAVHALRCCVLVVRRTVGSAHGCSIRSQTTASLPQERFELRHAHQTPPRPQLDQGNEGPSVDAGASGVQGSGQWRQIEVGRAYQKHKTPRKVFTHTPSKHCPQHAARAKRTRVGIRGPH